MNLGQHDLRSRGGILRSQPVRGDLTGASIVISHAMDRPPDRAFLQLTNIVADSSWLPGETLHYNPSTSASGFAIHMKPGLVEAKFQGNSLANVPMVAVDGSAAGIISAASWKVELVAVWFAIPASL